MKEGEDEIESAGSEVEYIASRAGARNIGIGALEELLPILSDSGFPPCKKIVIAEPCKPFDILSEKITREILYVE